MHDYKIIFDGDDYWCEYIHNRGTYIYHRFNRITKVDFFNLYDSCSSEYIKETYDILRLN